MSIPERRLQVFVSSTYEDLKSERQAAVEAILANGHIPAGMELFASGDESQLKVIRDWIEASDVFLLILGFRYGSIEPNSKKSYIQLEYEYAQTLRKPCFACVAHEEIREPRIKEFGSIALETMNASKYATFRKQVLSNLVSFWHSKEEIKFEVSRKMNEFERRADLLGWVRADRAVESNPLIRRMAEIVEKHSARFQVARDLENEMATFHRKKWAMVEGQIIGGGRAERVDVELRNVLDDVPDWSYVEDPDVPPRQLVRPPIQTMHNGARYWQIRSFAKEDNTTIRQFLASPAFHELLLWFRNVDRAFQEGIVLSSDIGSWWRQVLPIGWSGRLEYFRCYFEGYHDIQSMARAMVEAINYLATDKHFQKRIGKY
jgi:hypothetical protein